MAYLNKAYVHTRDPVPDDALAGENVGLVFHEAFDVWKVDEHHCIWGFGVVPSL